MGGLEEGLSAIHNEFTFALLEDNKSTKRDNGAGARGDIDDDWAVGVRE